MGKVKKLAAAASALCLALCLSAAPAFAVGNQEQQSAQEKGATQTENLLAAAGSYTVVASTTGGGNVTVTAGEETGASISAQEGTQVVVSPTLPSGSYLAQVRYAVASGASDAAGAEAASGEAAGAEAAGVEAAGAQAAGAEATTQASYGTYTAVTPNEQGQYAFTMPAGNVSVMVDYVSIVWDGTIDVTWYNTESKVFHLQYPAQFAGLAAIVNGIFTAYPTVTVVDDEGTGTSHEVPSYAAYQKVMGVVFEDEVAIGNNLYGEFATTYKLTDSQTEEFAAAYAGTSDTDASSLARTDAISVVQRFVGDAASVVAHVSNSNGSGGPNGQNLTTTSDYWFGSDDFDGKVVYLEADLDFGGKKNVDGTWNTSSPLFMPVSGQYCMLPGLEKTNGYSKLSSSWNGTLDGLGHSFKNVYCERYASGGNFGDSQSVGIVGRIGNHDSDYSTYKSTSGADGNYPAVNPTVRQIVLESGYISARRSTAGIVGKIGHTSATDLKDGSTGGIVEYCINKATVVGTDKKGIGGIVGAPWNNGRVSNCANFGSVSVLTYGSGFIAGGVVGRSEVTTSNCYNVGTVFAGKEGSQYAEAIGTNNGGAVWSNCYYLAGSDGNTKNAGVYEGTGTETVYSFGSGSTDSDGTAVDYTTLTADMLNGSEQSMWKDDTTGINAYDGVNYPVLYFQVDDFNPNLTYTITTQNPEEGGTFTASATSAPYATVITLSCTPIAGYTIDHYEVNGKTITGNSFAVEGDSVVTAVFRELTSATITLTNSDELDYTLTATKTGVIFEDGYTVTVSDYPVTSGDTVYEGDVITYSATIKEGAVPPKTTEGTEGEKDPNKYYTGEFSYKTFYSNTSAVSESSPYVIKESYTVTSTDVALKAAVSNAKSTYKNWASEADTSWYDEENLQANYTITTAEQLAGLAVLVNNDETFKGVTFTLGNNISLENTDGTTGVRNWTPIAYDESDAFKGTFDGNGYSITNMTINNGVSGSINLLRGLFGSLDGATVKNLTVSGSITGAAGNTCGGLAALATGASHITDCTVNVDITNKSTTTGGVVGKITGASEDSSANTTSSTELDASETAGEGTNGALIASCRVNAAISADGSSNTGVGGIVGEANYASITNCFMQGSVQSNTGNTTSKNNVGGIVGRGTAITISGCVNTAAVSSTITSSNLGGIVGYIDATSQNKISFVSSCVNQGTISGSAAYAAGIAGDVQGGCTIENCASVASVSSDKTAAYAAGIAGYVTNDAKTTDTTLALVINNCYTAGSLSAKNTAALVGYYVNGVITTTNDYYASDTATKAYAKKGSASKAPSTPTATSKTTDELKALAITLGEDWSADTIGLNSGYPVPVVSRSALLLGQRPLGVAQGDANMNGSINIVDAQIAYDIAKGLYQDDSQYLQRYALAEVNGDTYVDATDAFAIQYYIHYGVFTNAVIA